MSSQAFAVGLILVLFIVVFVRLTSKKTTGSGSSPFPQVPAETYLYYDPSDPSPSPSKASAIAKSFGAQVATPGDLAFYAAQGGSAGWYGITATGVVLAAPDPIYSPSNYVVAAPCQQTPYGIWLYGPKGAPDLKNVSPFNCTAWYQPASPEVAS